MSLRDGSGFDPSRAMNIMCWNCQGLGNPWTMQGLKRLIAFNFPSVLFLSETRCTTQEMIEIRRKLGWRNCFTVPCKFICKKGGKGVSRSGGLALLWKDNASIFLISYSDNHIDVRVGDVWDMKTWRFTGIYGFPKVQDRHRTWSLIRLLLQKSSLPWLLGGDFNEILFSHEKLGGPPLAERQMECFRTVVSDCSLIGLEPLGPKFTWCGNRCNEEIRMRLDRFLSTSSWTDLFPLSKTVNLNPCKSDHLPILIKICEHPPKKKRKKRRFKFEECWIQDIECKSLIDREWGRSTGSDPFSAICNKIGNTRLALMKWSKDRFGNLKEDIATVRAQLAVYYDTSLTRPLVDNRLALESKLTDLLNLEHAFWKQRAKVFWLTDGDMNTKFFQQQASNQRKKNLIKGLFDKNGTWCSTDEDIERTVLEYFGDIFSSTLPSNISEAVDVIPKVITEEMNASLTKTFSADEVFLALKQMHPSKAPGPDGFSPAFYQHFWPMVGAAVVDAVRCFLESDAKLKLLNGTYVTLIPKVKTPQSMEQLRPISLCNVLYKIGSKVLANRLKPLLNHFISPFQSAFVPGRLISDNSLLAFEIAHFLKHRRAGKVGYGALKLDMSKAYDCVEWPFLEAVMNKMGFNSCWIDWIMRCVKTVSYSFILNGEPRGCILPSRGLRQGDCISPYLFLLCAETLSRWISRAEELKLINGVKICRNAPSISHLFFADDSFILFRAEDSECRVLKNIFMNFEMASGQKINFGKSSICFSRNVILDRQFELAAILNVERVDKHDSYLGLPMDISYSKTAGFSFLKEKAKKKLQGWHEKLLSDAGKEVLIKAVIQSIPTYVMNCFELPKQLCLDIQQCMARFWWGAKNVEKGIHWLAWEELCVPKTDGGLGFRNLTMFNHALLAKQGWRLITKPNSVVARILKARYFPHSNFMEAVSQPGMSFMWRSILAGREVLSRGLRFHIGDGRSVSIWKDPWLPMPYSFKPFSPPKEGTEDWKVVDLIDLDAMEWKQPVIDDLFTKMEADLILKIPLSLRTTKDRLIWHYDMRGVFNVKSGYHVARTTDHKNQSLGSTSKGSCMGKGNLWNKVWKACIPPKIRSFIWRLLKGILPTRFALAEKVSLPDLNCLFCKNQVEHDVHIFKQCSALESFWNACSLGMLFNLHPTCSIIDWILDASSRLSSQQFDKFLTCLWVIWKERNNILWNGSDFCPLFMATWATNHLQDYQKLHPPKKVTKRRALTHWISPLSGRLKVNFDGSFRADEVSGGTGVVVRDDQGLCVAAFARQLPFASSALHVELEACRAGLLIAIHQGWTNIELESDCLQLVAALSNPCEDWSEVGRIVEDCKNYMRAFRYVQVRHIFREANCVAHKLAHAASFSAMDEFWLGRTPSIIEDVLFEDFCNCTRGSGITSPSIYNHFHP